MARTLLATIAGYILWTALWLTGSLVVQAGWPDALTAFTEGAPITAVAPLLYCLGLSVACSLAGGALAATIAAQPQRAVGALAGLLLLTGIGVQASSWSLMPVWYHLSFLALLAPMTLLGASLRLRAASDATAPGALSDEPQPLPAQGS